MKILDITHFYSEKSGGIKTYINSKIDYFATQKNIEHTIIIPGKENTLSYVKNSKIYKIKSPYLFVWRQYRLLINHFKISDIIKYEKPDIVEVGSMFLLPSIVKHLKSKLDFAVVGFFHSNIEKSLLALLGLKEDNALLSKTTRNYIYKTYKDMDLVIAPSNSSKTYLNSIGIYNVELVYHGLKLDVFQKPNDKNNLRKLFNIPLDKTILVYVGRFSKDKNFTELLEIFTILNKRAQNKFHLLLVGDGPDRKHVSKLKYGFTLLNYIKDKSELSKIYTLSDIFISPSKTDTFGYAIIEAQACGLPIVAYKDTSFSEIVFYKEFLAKDKDDFIQNIIYLSNNYHKINSDSIKTFIQKNFDIKNTMSKLAHLYESIQVKVV